MRLRPATGGVLALSVVLAASAAGAPCGEERDDLDAVAVVRTTIEAECDCPAAPTHGAYVACARSRARDAVRAKVLPARCLGSVVRCAARSTCGRPDTVACCVTRGGATRCRTASTAERCLARGGCPSAVSSCCDACGDGGCTPGTTSTTSVSTTTAPSTTTICAPVCGNGVCETGEAPGTCDCGAVLDAVPLLPVAVGACLFDDYEQSGNCARLPTIRVPDDTACGSSLSHSAPTVATLIDLLPATCCAGSVCGGGETVALSVGDTIATNFGQSTAVLQILADCLADGQTRFRVPIVACGECGALTTVLGFTRVDLETVTLSGAEPGFTLSRPCPRCLDGVCSTEETCRTCWNDCGPCEPVCG